MARVNIPDDSVLLCEGCGYEIDLVEGGLCPECARPVADSLGEARTGSPWQRNPGVLTWLRTGWDMLARPVREFDSVRVDPDDRVLLWANSVVAGVLLAFAWPIIQHDLVSSSSPMIDFMIVAPLGVLIVRALIAVEQWGTVFFGRRRGWRITPAIARAICAHAAIGWVIGGGLSLAGWLLGTVLEASLRTSALGLVRPIVILSPRWMPIAGLLAGMMVFELLSHIGMRRMRFVNPGPRPKKRNWDSETGRDRPA